MGVDIGILFPDNLLQFAPIPNREYAVAVMQAYNRWLMAEWLHEPGLYGAMLVAPQDPEAAAREIERYARRGADRRDLPAHGGRASPVGRPQVRPDHGGGGSGRLARAAA